MDLFVAKQYGLEFNQEVKYQLCSLEAANRQSSTY